MTSTPLTLSRVVRFWLPLAGTWLMMSAEGPLLAAVIARLADPTYNLAAYGVAFSLALIVEAPVIMMLSAATALVRDRDSYLRLRNFTHGLIALISVALIVIVFPPVFRLLAEGLLGLEPEVARRSHLALVILLPWPGTIGYRRFYQGIMIRFGQTSRVAYGTVLRLVTMAGTAFFAATATSLDGAAVGALALSAGVTVEALVSRAMADGAVRRVLGHQPADNDQRLDLGVIIAFYTPLAMTSLLGLAVHPMVTFFMGHSRMALESLAVLPVVNSLVFVFRSLGLAAQEVFIALMGEDREGLVPLRRFAILLGVLASAGLSLISWTPLAELWFEGASGLEPGLARFALAPARILGLIPALTVLLSWQRATLVHRKHTSPVTWATLTEVLVAAAVLAIAVLHFDVIGAVAAALALVTGRITANLYLHRWLRKRVT